MMNIIRKNKNWKINLLSNVFKYSIFSTKTIEKNMIKVYNKMSMNKVDIKLFEKIFKIILVITWMIIVFYFSGQKGEKSGNTSRRITETIIQAVSNRSLEENEKLIETADKVIRKLAHYTIYTIGGLLIINYADTTEKSKKEKVLGSIMFGTVFAVTDEMHQFFVSERSARIFDVGIDTLGVITGVIIYLIIKNLFKENKK